MAVGTRKRRKPRLNGTACIGGRRCIAVIEIDGHRFCPKHGADALWRRRILERDRFCRRCGSAVKLQAAHIMSRRFGATRWQLGNGLALGGGPGSCGCHLWQTEHREEGDDFFRSVIGDENFDALRHMALTFDPEDPRDALERLGGDRTQTTPS